MCIRDRTCRWRADGNVAVRGSLAFDLWIWSFRAAAKTEERYCAKANNHRLWHRRKGTKMTGRNGTASQIRSVPRVSPVQVRQAPDIAKFVSTLCLVFDQASIADHFACQRAIRDKGLFEGRFELEWLRVLPFQARHNWRRFSAIGARQRGFPNTPTSRSRPLSPA